MKNNVQIIFLLTLLALAVFSRSLLNFFAQDDFILIDQFARQGLAREIINVFGPPDVTHWRPFHNLYFFISGNFFGKNVALYHIFTFAIQIASGFLIIKCLKKLNFNDLGSFIAGIIYVVHPAHFVTYYWVSGGATAIGFLFFIASFYMYLEDRKKAALLLFIFSLLASEAMISGFIIFLFYFLLFDNRRNKKRFLTQLFSVTLLFIVIKLYLTPQSTFSTYAISITPEVFATFKYYILRILAFPGVNGDQILTAFVLAWLGFVALIFVNKLKNEISYKQLCFLTLGSLVGLLPFLLLPKHVSPHYMNISIFFIAAILGFSLANLDRKVALCMITLYIVISYFSVRLIEKDSWVTKRALIAQKYIETIQEGQLEDDATFVFNDNYISTSYEAYVALGMGKAIDFWFEGKNYKTCFWAFENCNNIP